MTDINALVGRKIGLEPILLYGFNAWTGEHTKRGEQWPDFRNDIAAAWKLVEWMKEQGYRCKIEVNTNPLLGTFVEFTPNMAPDRIIRKRAGNSWHENPATAIFLAFCAANGIEVEQHEEVPL